MAKLSTPYYLIDENLLKENLKIIDKVRALSGAKTLLALKCFATWGVFNMIRDSMDGTTSSSLFEARLGYEEFGKEVHAYSVGFAKKEVKSLRKIADKVIFNSISQLTAYHKYVDQIPLGLRVNPGISYSNFDLADPARKYSRLGVIMPEDIAKVLPLLSGIMLHFNCENDDFTNLANALDLIAEKYAEILKKLSWVSLGGGIFFTKHGYPIEDFSKKIKEFSQKFNVQVYLEPGEAVITNSAELVTTVIDVVHNELDIAIIDASVEAHMLDHLIYHTNPNISFPKQGKNPVIIAGRTCLAGDVFGKYQLKARLKIGDEVRIADAAGYTMVKKNWFNGVAMPTIAVRRINGEIEIVRKFSYKDFKSSLS